MEDDLFRLHDELINKTYNHLYYTPFYITDPKRRHIHKACVRDRIVHHAVFRTLYPLFDKSFIFDSYSCRKGKGTHKAVKKLEQYLCKASKNYTCNVFALKCDIFKFFDSIDQKILLNLILKKLKDEDTLWLLKKIMHSFEKSKGKGIPLGNVTSQLFANIYLNELDQFMKHKLKVKNYARYSDDFIVVHKNRNYLLGLIPFIQFFLERELQLKLHPKKVTVRKLSHGIDFLGYIILPYFKLLRTKTKKRIYKKTINLLVLLEQSVISQNKLRNTLESYRGVLKHCKGRKIKKAIWELGKV